MQSLQASKNINVKKGMDAYQRGDYGETIQQAEILLDEDSISKRGFYLKIIALIAERKFHDALDILKKALQEYPTDMELQNSVGIAYQGLRRYKEAEERFKWSAKAYPDHPAPYVLLANLMRDQRKVEAEIEYLEGVLKRSPGHVPTMLLLMQIFEASGDHDKAEIYAKGILVSQPGHPMALASRMRVLMDKGNFDDAIKLGTETFQAGQYSVVSDDMFYGALGDAYHRNEQYEQAWAAYLNGASKLVDRFKDSFGDPDMQFGLNNIEMVGDYFENRPISKTPPTDKRFSDTLFLIGFPRSGTTLLELMLGAHPQLTTSHERSTLGFLLDKYGRSRGHLDQFFDLDDVALETERESYLDGISDIKRDVFLNKYPLYLSWSGLAGHLLPGSRFILAIRDPRDCALSAFRQRFRMNAGMYNLLTVESAARYYAATMRAGLAGFKAMNIDPVIVKYESLAEDPEDELKRVFEGLGMEWDPDIMKYNQGDRLEHIHTPSSRQIFKPVSKSSIGQWKNYKDQMNQACKILQPWVEHWGYDE